MTAAAISSRTNQPAEPFWQSAVKVGLAGGLAATLFALVGMVEAFGGRPVIGDALSLGETLVALAMVLAGYMAGRRALATGGPGSSVAAGALAGATVGLMLALLVQVGQRVDLRQVLNHASPGMYEVLTFEQGTARGSLLLVAAGAVLGGLTGAILLLPPLARGMVFSALAVVIAVGVLGDLIRLIVSGWRFGNRNGFSFISWMFAGKGLSLAGAAVVAVLAAVAFARPLRRRPARRPGLTATSHTVARRPNWVGLIAMLAVLAVLPPLLGTYMSEVLNQVGLMVLMGLGLNIVVGFAGLLDLGYVAFYAIGAYSMGILTSPELGFFSLNWWVGLPIAIGMAVLAGVLLGIPVLKMRGDYLAIVTLGFGEIIQRLVLSDWLRPYLGGAQGIQQIARPAVGSLVFDTTPELYYVLLVGCIVAAFVSWRLRDSRMGRAWMALREDEDVAEAIGINLVQTKLLAFATGAAFSGLSGAIFAAKLSAIYPNSFGLLISINVLALIIIGGMGSIPGVVVGALALAGLPELLREFAEFRLLVYGIVLVVMMLYRPEGLWPSAARQRELHGKEDVAAEEAQAEPAQPEEATIEVGAPLGVTGGGRETKP